MSWIQPLSPFLRPLGIPRAPASRQLFRFSTSRPLRVDTPIVSASSPTVPLPAAATPATPASPSPKAPSRPPKAPKTAPIAKSPASKPDPRAQKSKPYKPSQFTRKSKDAPKPKSTLEPPALSKAKTMKLRPSKPREPKITGPTPTTLALPPPKYHISRSHNKNYPIYTDFKRGGNLHLTTIRKITGDLSALRDELRVFLNKQDGEVKINQLTSHVIVKGHHVLEITEFLKARGL